MEKLKRKNIERQDKHLPFNIEQLLQEYDLDKLFDKVNEIVDYINKKEV